MSWRLDVGSRHLYGGLEASWSVEVLDGERADDTRVGFHGYVDLDTAKVDEFYERLAALIEECKP